MFNGRNSCFCTDVAWCPERGAINPWIQVEFPDLVYITGVITQIGDFADHPDEWLEEYQVAYSNDGQLWHNVTDADGTPTTVSNIIINHVHNVTRLYPVDLTFGQIACVAHVELA